MNEDLRDTARQLGDALVELAQARPTLLSAVECRLLTIAEIEKTAAHRNYQAAEEALRLAQTRVRDLETCVRELAIEEWALTDDKHPSGYVTIRQGRAFDVDENVALTWAKTNAPALLALDRSYALKYARHVEPVPGITETVTITAAIDKDLSALLKEDGDE